MSDHSEGPEIIEISLETRAKLDEIMAATGLDERTIINACIKNLLEMHKKEGDAIFGDIPPAQ